MADACLFIALAEVVISLLCVYVCASREFIKLCCCFENFAIMRRYKFFLSIYYYYLLFLCLFLLFPVYFNTTHKLLQ